MRLFSPGSGAGSPPLLLGFAGRGSLAGWIRVIATRDGVRMLRQRAAEVPLEEVPLEEELLAFAMSPQVGPELASLKQGYREEFKRAFSAALAQLPSRQRKVLRAHVLGERTLDDIAAEHGVNKSTVSRWLAAAREAIATITFRELSRSLNIPVRDVPDVLELIQSQLDVTLSGLTSSAGGGARH